MSSAEVGIAGNLEEWLALNESHALGTRDASGLAPFPPAALMTNTTGLTRDEDFAAHGVHITRQIATLSPRPLRDFACLLDFGVGVGRLARMFHGFAGRYVGIDIDAENIAWVAQNYSHVEAVKTQPGEPLPFPDGTFDAVAIISVFTHMTEADHAFYLGELCRVTCPGAYLFVSVHGQRALERAEQEPAVFELLNIPLVALRKARRLFDGGTGYSFTMQRGHLTSLPPRPLPRHARLLRRSAPVPKPAYSYGITFIDSTYILGVWSQYFEVVRIWRGAIHDFQDLLLLRTRDPQQASTPPMPPRPA